MPVKFTVIERADIYSALEYTKTNDMKTLNICDISKFFFPQNCVSVEHQLWRGAVFIGFIVENYKLQPKTTIVWHIFCHKTPLDRKIIRLKAT